MLIADHINTKPRQRTDLKGFHMNSTLRMRRIFFCVLVLTAMPTLACAQATNKWTTLDPTKATRIGRVLTNSVSSVKVEGQWSPSEKGPFLDPDGSPDQKFGKLPKWSVVVFAVVKQKPFQKGLNDIPLWLQKDYPAVDAAVRTIRSVFKDFKVEGADIRVIEGRRTSTGNFELLVAGTISELSADIYVMMLDDAYEDNLNAPANPMKARIASERQLPAQFDPPSKSP